MSERTDHQPPSPCPKCGGDRFSVSRERGGWFERKTFCRACEGRKQGADLFGETDTRFSGNPNAYFGQPGAGPTGKTCGDCRHCHGGRYKKCGLVRETAGPGTDIRLKTPACQYFKEDE